MQTQPFETVAEKYSSSDISIMLFTEENIFTVAIPKKNLAELECGLMPNVLAALPNIGGALCSTPQFG